MSEPKSDVFEMNGAVRVPGKPHHLGGDGKNWCYTYTFLVNTSAPVCDLSIVTQDLGAALWLGVLSQDPDINPETPEKPTDEDEKPVKDGIRMKRGKLSEGGPGKPRKGSFVEDDPQLNEREDDKEENRDWNNAVAQRDKEGPLQPGGWRRGTVDGELPDPKESSDMVRLKFEPCLQPGDAFTLTLCFDEKLDENDLINFLPSRADGSGFTSGDVTPSETLSFDDLFKLISALAGAVPLGMKTPNKERRKLYAQRIVQDKLLMREIAQLVGEVDTPSVASLVAAHGVGPVLERISPDDVVEAMGSDVLLDSLGARAALRGLGVKRVAAAIDELGLTEALKAELDSAGVEG